MQAYDPPFKFSAIDEVLNVNCVDRINARDRSAIRRNRVGQLVCHDLTAARIENQPVGALCFDLDPGEDDEHVAQRYSQNACYCLEKFDHALTGDD